MLFFCLLNWCLHLILCLTSRFLMFICQPKWQIPASDLRLLLLIFVVDLGSLFWLSRLSSTSPKWPVCCDSYIVIYCTVIITKFLFHFIYLFHLLFNLFIPFHLFYFYLFKLDIFHTKWVLVVISPNGVCTQAFLIDESLCIPSCLLLQRGLQCCVVEMSSAGFLPGQNRKSHHLKCDQDLQSGNLL